MKASSRASSPQGSWRKSTKALEAGPLMGSKRPLRALLALVVLGLFAGFGWLIWQPVKSEPPMYFVAMLTGRTDLLSVPPILFEQETMAPLERLGDAKGTLNLVNAASAQLSADAGAIQSTFADLAVAPSGRLVVYVSAHGVSDDGKAYVLARNYDPTRPKEGRYLAADLIRAVSNIDAQTKLIVFDCARLAIDPRIGLAANEFASIVEKAAQKANDPQLWVMTAGAELETSPIGLAEHRSILGGAIVDGLLGGADASAAGANGDGKVSLAELNNYVRQQCAKAPVATPVPRLIHATSEPTPAAVEDRLLFRVPAPEVADGQTKPAADEKPSQAKPNPDAPRNTAAVTQPDNAQPSVTRASLAAAPAPPATIQSPAGDSAAKPAAAAPAPAAASTAADAPEAGAAAQPAAAPVDGPLATAAPAAAPQAAAGTEPGKAATAPATPPATAPAAPPPSQAVDDRASPAIRTWRIRDRLQQAPQTNGQGASPIDYAPHLWNKLNATLVALNLLAFEHSAPAADGASKPDDELARYEHGLESLAGGSAPSGGGLVTDELANSFVQYRQHGVAQDLQSLKSYGDALVDLRRNLSRAREYVQWHAAVVGSGGSAGQAGATIRELLDELGRLDEQIAELERAPLQSWEDVNGLLNSIEISRGRIGGLLGQLDRAVDASIASISESPDASSQRDLERLLSTSLATAKQRETLLAALARPTDKAAATQSAPPRWNAIFNHLKLELRLAQLADPGVGSSEAFKLAMAQPSVSESPDDRQRDLIRTAGDALRTFYAQLPERVAGLRQAESDPAAQRTVEKLVALMHPRDVSLAPGGDAFALGFLSPRLKPPAEIGMAPPPTTDLTSRSWIPLRWDVQLQNVSTSQIQAILEGYDSASLRIRFPSETEDARPGDVRTLKAGDPLVLHVRANGERNGPRQARLKVVRVKLRVQTDVGKREAPSQAQVVLPRPNRVELTATCVEPRTVQTGDRCIKLRPYPNRNTSFEFELANLADTAKNLHVELLAIPAPATLDPGAVNLGWPPGLLLDNDKNVPPVLAAWLERGAPDATVVAVADVSLAADEKKRLDMKPPGGDKPAAEEKKPDAPAATPAPEPPAAPPVVNISHGLLCRITNADPNHPDEVWTTWIEVTPLRPTSYLDFEPEVDERDVRFKVAPAQTGGDGKPELPPGILKKPILLVARGDDTVFQSRGVSSVELSLEHPQGLVTIQPLESVTGRRMVALEVDGFPRAAIWNVDFENQSAEQIQTLTALRIERLGMGGAAPVPPRLYRMAPYTTYPPIDEKKWPNVVNAIDSICAFDISQDPQGVRPLEMRLSVDAPLDAFTSVGGENGVFLSWENNEQPPIRLNDDRDVKSQLFEVAKTGEISILTSVDDFNLTLPRPAVTNKSVWLNARIAIEGNPDEQVSRLRVIFDGQPPKLTAALVHPSIWEGTLRFDVNVQLEDISGVKKVEAWALGKQPRSEADLKPDEATELLLPDAGPLPVDAPEIRRLPLSVPAPPKAGDYFVVLKATDGSGQSITTLSAPPLRLSVVKRPPPVVAPVIGDLRGRVLLGAKPPTNALTLTITETPEGASRKVSTDAQGRFLVPKLKAGSYKLSVSGRVGSGKVVGEQEVALKELADYQRELEITAEFQLTEPPKP